MFNLIHRVLKIKTLFLIFCLSTNFVFAQEFLAQEFVVEELQLDGNQNLSDSKIKKSLKTQENPWYNLFLFWREKASFQESSFLNDLLRIEKLYKQEGFLNAKVEDYKLDFNEKEKFVKISIQINEGKESKIDSISFKSVETDSLPQNVDFAQKLKLKNGKRFREEDLVKDYEEILEKFSDSGFPYIEARVKPEIDSLTNQVDLEWRLRSGEFYKFGEIDVQENKEVNSKVVKKGLEFKPNQTFNQSKLEVSHSQIYRLELFQYVNIQTKTPNEKNEIPITVVVKEKKQNSINYGIGYGTEETYRTKVNWTNRNFLGGARILRTEAKHAGKILPLKIEVKLSQPFFLDNQNNLTVKPYFIWQDEESYESKKIGIETIFDRQLTEKTNFFVTTKVERDTVRAKSVDLEKELSDFYYKSVIRTGVIRNTTNKLFSPTKGTISKFEIEESGLLFKSNFNYYKASFGFRVYKEIFNDFVLASRIFVGAMKPYGSSRNTPVDERFYSGGANSVRGWQRQALGPRNFAEDSNELIPVGGNSKIEGNFEQRFPIYKDFSGALFLDYGNVWSKWNSYDLNEIKFSWGTGLRYSTPIGPIRIDLAWKLNKQEVDKSSFNFFLSIGNAF